MNDSPTKLISLNKSFNNSVCSTRPQTLEDMPTEAMETYQKIGQTVKNENLSVQLMHSLIIVDSIEGNKGFIDKRKIKDVMDMHGVQVSAS